MTRTILPTSSDASKANSRACPPALEAVPTAGTRHMRMQISCLLAGVALVTASDTGSRETAGVKSVFGDTKEVLLMAHSAVNGYRHRYKPGFNRARQHVAARRRLTERFAGIDRDVEQRFYDLAPDEMESLLEEYGQRFGQKAASYARQTLPRWRSGAVTMSGQTAERLLSLLPPRLSSAERFALIQKLRRECLHRPRRAISVTPEDWRKKVQTEIESVLNERRSQALPAHLASTAQWLTAEDSRAAQSLLRRAEEEEARTLTDRVPSELARLEAIARNVAGARQLAHRIVLPQGEIHVRFLPPRKSLTEHLKEAFMPTNDTASEELARIGAGALDKRRTPSNLLDVAVEGLTADEAREIRRQAIQVKLGLDQEAAAAERRFFDSSQDMARDVAQAERLQRGRDDYSLKGEYRTASGRTELQISKSTSRTVVIVAVVLAVLFLVILL